MYSYLLDNRRDTAGVQRRLARSQSSTINDVLTNYALETVENRAKAYWMPEACCQALGMLGWVTPSAIVLEYDNELDLLKDVLFGAVKIKLMLHIILQAFDKPPKTRRKLLIFCAVPKTALFVHLLLGFIGFKAILSSSHTTPAARAKLLENLNRKGVEGGRGDPDNNLRLEHWRAQFAEDVVLSSQPCTHVRHSFSLVRSFCVWLEEMIRVAMMSVEACDL
jgi:hypothetical protein